MHHYLMPMEPGFKLFYNIYNPPAKFGVYLYLYYISMPQPQARHMNYTGFDLKTIGTQVRHATPKFYPGMEYIKVKDMEMDTNYYYELRNPCEGEGCIIDKFIVQLVEKFDRIPSIKIKIIKVIKNPSELPYKKNEIYSVPIYSNHTYYGSIHTATYYKMKSPGILANNLLPPYVVGQTVQKYLGPGPVGPGGKRKTKKGKNKRKQTKKRKVKTIKKNKKR